MEAHGAVPADEAGRLAESSVAQLIVADGQGRVVAWGAGEARPLGYSAEEAVGGRVDELLAAVPPWRSGQEEWHGELPVAQRDGHQVEVPVSAYRLRDADSGEALSLLMVRTPPAHPPLPSAQALSDWVLSCSPIALAVYDTGMRCVQQNEAMRRLSGLSDEERTGRGVSAPLTGPDTAVWEARIRQALTKGRTERDFRLRGRIRGDPDHEHLFTATASPLRDGMGRVAGVCFTVLDITQEFRSQERLALLNEASTRIGSTLDIGRTGQELADVAVPRLADFVSVDLLETLLNGDEPAPGPVTGAVLRRVAHRSIREGTPEAVAEVGDVDIYSANSPQARCLATGRSELHHTKDPAVSSWMADEPVRRVKAEKYGFHSWTIVPVTARGITLGVVVMVRSRNREPFGEGDLELAEELAARAAVCLDNARRFTRERTEALALQHSLLPRRLPEQSAVDAACRYLPASPRLGVGGDWFDVIPLSGTRVALVVGDVVGHGIHASATMGRLRTAVRTLADVDLAPDELLTHLDDLVVRLAAEAEPEPGEEVAGDDMAADYPAGGHVAGDIGATCLYAVYDPVSGVCCLARAGHLAPVVVSRDGIATALDPPPGPPLGLGELPFEAMETVLPEGSLLALFTDGLVQPRQCGMDRRLKTLRGALTTPSPSLEALCDHVVATMLPNRPADDAALLLARVRRLDPGQIAVWDVPAAPEAVAVVRAGALGRLSAWDLEEMAFPTELVVSELVTNAVRYGGGPIQLRLIRDRTLICEVFDGTGTAPHPRRARVLDEGGRGLMLVAQLTERWGTRQTQAGKVIWCEQALPDGSLEGTGADR